MHSLEALLSSSLGWPDRERTKKDKMMPSFLVSEHNVERWAALGVRVRRGFRSRPTESVIILEATSQNSSRILVAEVRYKANSADPEMTLKTYGYKKSGTKEPPRSFEDLIALIDQMVDIFKPPA